MALHLTAFSSQAASSKAAAQKGAQEAAALCPDKKAIVFACKTKENKLVAVCGAADSPQMTLRYMTAGQKDTLLTLPRDSANAPDATQSISVGSMMYAGGGGAYVRFKDGDKDYVVYSGMGRGWEQAGLSVLKGEEHLEDPLCLAGDKPLRDFVVERGKQAGYRVEGEEHSEFELP